MLMYLSYDNDTTGSPNFLKGRLEEPTTIEVLELILKY